MISFHGFDPEAAVDVYLGGQIDRSVRQQVANHIQNSTGLLAKVAEADDRFYNQYGGQTDSNITNRWSKNGGLQLEQKQKARDNYVEEICRAVIDIFSEN